MKIFVSGGKGKDDPKMRYGFSTVSIKKTYFTYRRFISRSEILLFDVVMCMFMIPNVFGIFRSTYGWIWDAGISGLNANRIIARHLRIALSQCCALLWLVCFAHFAMGESAKSHFNAGFPRIHTISRILFLQKDDLSTSDIDKSFYGNNP